MTLSELKTLIQNYVENEETTFVNTGVTYLTAPSDFISSFSLAVIDASGDYHFLDKKHPSFMREYTVDPTDTSLRGLPKYYGDFDKEISSASDNGSTLILAPVPDSNYTVELHYLYKPASLTSNTSGTWISKNARNALLYGCLVEANTFMKGETDLMQQYEQRFLLEISRLKNQAEARGRRDEYRQDSLRTSVS